MKRISCNKVQVFDLSAYVSTRENEVAAKNKAEVERLPVETTPVAPPNETVEGAEERVEAHRSRVEREEPTEEHDE